MRFHRPGEHGFPIEPGRVCLPWALLAFGAVVPAHAAPGDPAEATAQFLTASDLDLLVADLAGVYASTPGGPATDAAAFDALVFAALTDQLALLSGGLGQIPLVYDGGVLGGLLSIAQTDIEGFAGTDALSALAASGAIDPLTGDFTELSTGGSTVNLAAIFDGLGVSSATRYILSQIDLAAIFDGLGVSSATRYILSQIDLQLGTAASQAGAEAYGAVSSDYRLDALGLELTSPLLAALPDVIDLGMQGATLLVGEAIDLLLPGGTITLPPGTVPDIPVLSFYTLELGAVTPTIAAPDFNSVVSSVMSQPGGVILVSDDGLATVNLNTGEIFIDLAELYGGSVEGLGANTEVFTSGNMAAISDAVGNALGKSTALFANAFLDALMATPLGVSIDVELVQGTNPLNPNLNGLTLITGTVSGAGSLKDFADGNGVFTAAVAQVPGLPTCAAPLVFGVCLAPTSTIVGGLVTAVNTVVPATMPTLAQAVAAPLVLALQDAADPIIAEIEAEVADVYAAITGAFDWLMPALAGVVINEQPAVGDLGPDSFTVRALGVTLMPNFPQTNAAHVGFASSTVIAFAEPAVDIVELEVIAGDPVTITGTGWNPAGGDVTLYFEDAAGDPVGAPFTATVAPDGSISSGFVVPEGTDAGVLTLFATQGDATRTDTVTVVQPGGESGGGGLADSGAALPLLPGAAALILIAAGAATLIARRRLAAPVSAGIGGTV